MTLSQAIQEKTKDGILWLAERWWNEIGEQPTPAKVGVTMRKIARLLLKLKSKSTRTLYAKEICKQIKHINISDLKATLSDVEYEQEKADKKQPELIREVSGLDEERIPNYLDKDMVIRWGFSPRYDKYANGEPKRDFGYNQYTDQTGSSQITNFMIKPIFHIYEGKESKFVVEIDNGYNKSVVMLEQHRAMFSKDVMQAEVGGEGNYFIFGSNLAFQRVASYLMHELRDKVCMEVKKLGWQRNGFWAYMDSLFVPGIGLQNLDEWGMATVAKKSYIVPAASAAYAKQKESNPERFENEDLLTYCESPFDFAEYLEHMAAIFGDNGLVGVAYGVMTLFRDIIFDINGCFPHLNGVGPKSTGKSIWAFCISQLFYQKRDFFQLNSGTDAGFYTYLAQFPNAPAVMNEFDRQHLKQDEWFYAFKGLYDGEGKVKNSMTQRGKNENVKVLSGIILLGQYLNTDDDNAVVSRSLLCSFSRTDFDQEEITRLNKFNELIEHGMNSLLGDLLSLRSEFKNRFRERYTELMRTWRDAFPKDEAYNQRIMQNWCYAATTMGVVSNGLDTGSFDLSKFVSTCFKKGVDSCRQLRETDGLSDFWRLIEFLCSQRHLVYGWDYMIEMQTSVKIKIGAKGSKDVELGEPTQVLYLQLNTAHKLYQSEHRKTSGQAGFPLQTISTYMETRDYSIGLVPSKRRQHGNRSGNTSFHAFRYDDLQIDIDTEEFAQAESRVFDPNNKIEPDTKPSKAEDKELPF